MINRIIMKELIEKTGRSKSQVYRMIQKKKREYQYTITKETAANLLAADVGIDISKILSTEELRELRTIAKPIPTPSRFLPTTPEQEERPGVVINISENVSLIEPFLSKSMAKEAERMAEIYPIIYVFENSVRNLIGHILEKGYGTDWWNKKVSLQVQRKVQRRKKEEKKVRWHGRRKAHEIFYTDIGDLISIITTNWMDFEPILDDLAWVKTCIGSIELSRNIIAHNNPLTMREISRIKMYFDDWIRQIKKYADE